MSASKRKYHSTRAEYASTAVSPNTEEMIAFLCDRWSKHYAVVFHGRRFPHKYLHDLELAGRMNEIAEMLAFLGVKIPYTFELSAFGCVIFGSNHSIPVIEHAEFGNYIY
jgi:hypothetical protein